MVRLGTHWCFSKCVRPLQQWRQLRRTSRRCSILWHWMLLAGLISANSIRASRPSPTATRIHRLCTSRQAKKGRLASMSKRSWKRRASAPDLTRELTRPGAIGQTTTQGAYPTAPMQIKMEMTIASVEGRYSLAPSRFILALQFFKPSRPSRASDRCV